MAGNPGWEMLKEERDEVAKRHVVAGVFAEGADRGHCV